MFSKGEFLIQLFYKEEGQEGQRKGGRGALSIPCPCCHLHEKIFAFFPLLLPLPRTKASISSEEMTLYPAVRALLILGLFFFFSTIPTAGNAFSGPENRV